METVSRYKGMTIGALSDCVLASDYDALAQRLNQVMVERDEALRLAGRKYKKMFGYAVLASLMIVVVVIQVGMVVGAIHV